MNKKETLVKFLGQLPLSHLVAVHNEYHVKRHETDMLLYSLNEEHINMFFGTSAHLFLAIKASDSFDPNAKYFRLPQAQITTQYEFDLETLAEFLISWGDGGLGILDPTPMLVENFKVYMDDSLCGALSEDEISKLVDESNADFLMDDWDGIMMELFDNVIGICPYCHYALTREERGEYNYDTGRTLYTCPECKEEFYL